MDIEKGKIEKPTIEYEMLLKYLEVYLGNYVTIWNNA